MFGFLKDAYQRIYETVTSKVNKLFHKQTIDTETLKELERILIQADIGTKTTNAILASLNKQYQQGTLQKGEELKHALQAELNAILNAVPPRPLGDIILLVGINGSGKTTFAGKLTHYYAQQGKRVLLVAADTFRAAAPQQLTEWAKKSNAEIFCGTPNQDPAAVVFQGCAAFRDKGFDTLIIDTAGRLQTKSNLLKELEKIKRTIQKQLPDRSISTLITIDAMLGQNSFEQARLFHECTQLDGIILTKMDGTGKGGIVFAITQELSIPVAFISFGESATHIKPFDAQAYVHQLLNE